MRLSKSIVRITALLPISDQTIRHLPVSPEGEAPQQRRHYSPRLLTPKQSLSLSLMVSARVGWRQSCPLEGMSDSASRTEVLIGRSLAACVHPYAAWHFGSVPVRAWVLAAYFATGYLAVFCALELVLLTSAGL